MMVGSSLAAAAAIALVVGFWPRQTVVAHLHPDDWARCQMAREASADGAGRIRFVADPSVPRAECVLETSEGIVQAAVDDHLDGIGEALSGAE